MVVLAMSSTAIFAQIEEQKVPEDTALRKGTLDNGLTYYVRKCSKPEKKAELRLVVNVGSNQEKDNERGISHFVEHMMFKGTKHFAGQSATEYLRHCGVALGADANAFTVNDFTTYMISGLPLTSEERLDSCLLLLRDWAGDALMKDADIESERNVIVEEWRSHALRSYMYNTQKDLNGESPYANVVFGDMNIIQGCKPKVIRNYYKHWYQPQNMAVIATGDFDVNVVISHIKSMFSDLKRGKNIPTVYPLPADVDTPQVHSYDLAKSDFSSVCEVLVKLPIITSEELATVGGQREKFFQNTLCEALKRTLRETANNSKEISSATVLITPNPNERCKALELIAQCQPEHMKTVCETLYKELEKAKRKGTEEVSYYSTDTSLIPCEYNNDSTAIDFAATRDSLNHFFQANFSDSIDNNLKSVEWANNCTDAFLFGKPLLSNASSQIVDNHIGRSNTNEIYKTKFAEYLSGKNMHTFFLVSGGGPKPTEDEIKEIAERVHNMTDEELDANNAEAKELKTLDVDSVDINPIPGKIIKRTKNKDGYTELTLSNGIKAFLYADKDAKNIAITLKRKGGTSLFENKDIAYSKFLNNCEQAYIAFHGTITYPSIGKSDEYIACDASSDGFEAVMKWMYATLTSTKIDTVKFDKHVLDAQKIAQSMLNPFSKQIVEINYLPWASTERDIIYTKDKVDDLSIERYQQLLNDYKSNYNGAAIIIRGKFDTDSIMPFVAKYIGGLPSKATPSHFIVRPEDHFKDKDEAKVVYFENATPITQLAIYYALEKGYKYTEEHYAQREVLCNVLQNILFNRLRVQHSDVYTPSCNSGEDQYPVSRTVITIQFSCNPENRERIVEDINTLMKEVAEGNIITQEMIDGYISLREKNTKEPDNKNHAIADEYINRYLNDDVYIDSNNLSYIKKVTPESLKAYLKNILDNGHRFVGYLTTK